MLITLAEGEASLQKGQAIAVPTDTVYGLACQNPDVLYEIKRRPESKQILLLCATAQEVAKWLEPLPQDLWERVQTLWPGAFSLVTHVKKDNPFTSLPTIGFRVPAHAKTLELLSRTGPLFVTSANLSGEPALQSAQQVEACFGENFPVLEGAIPSHAEPSTIVYTDGQSHKVLRRGSLSSDILQHVFPAIVGL